jgi:hypothetical protein
MDRVGLGSWKPRERAARLGAFVLLVLSTATVLTHAYYLQFLEPGPPRPPETSRAINPSIEHYREAGVRYLIVSSTVYERLGPGHRQTRAYRRPFETCRLVKEFAPEPGKTMGPTIRILEIPKG